MTQGAPGAGDALSLAARSVFVSGHGPDVSASELEKLFRMLGSVESFEAQYDAAKGISGYAVVFVRHQEAATAVQHLNQLELKSNRITVESSVYSFTTSAIDDENKVKEAKENKDGQKHQGNTGGRSKGVTEVVVASAVPLAERNVINQHLPFNHLVPGYDIDPWLIPALVEMSISETRTSEVERTGTITSTSRAVVDKMIVVDDASPNAQGNAGGGSDDLPPPPSTAAEKKTALPDVEDEGDTVLGEKRKKSKIEKEKKKKSKKDKKDCAVVAGDDDASDSESDEKKKKKSSKKDKKETEDHESDSDQDAPAEDGGVKKVKRDKTDKKKDKKEKRERRKREEQERLDNLVLFSQFASLQKTIFETTISINQAKETLAEKQKLLLAKRAEQQRADVLAAEKRAASGHPLLHYNQRIDCTIICTCVVPGIYTLGALVEALSRHYGPVAQCIIVGAPIPLPEQAVYLPSRSSEDNAAAYWKACEEVEKMQTISQAVSMAFEFQQPADFAAAQKDLVRHDCLRFSSPKDEGILEQGDAQPPPAKKLTQLQQKEMNAAAEARRIGLGILLEKKEDAGGRHCLYGRWAAARCIGVTFPCTDPANARTKASLQHPAASSHQPECWVDESTTARWHQHIAQLVDPCHVSDGDGGERAVGKGSWGQGTM